MTDHSEFVRRARAKLGLTREEFGKQLGVGRHSIWRYETKRYELPEALRLAINHLLARHGTRKGKQP